VKSIRRRGDSPLEALTLASDKHLNTCTPLHDPLTTTANSAHYKKGHDESATFWHDGHTLQEHVYIIDLLIFQKLCVSSFRQGNGERNSRNMCTELICSYFRYCTSQVSGRVMGRGTKLQGDGGANDGRRKRWREEMEI